MKPLPIFLVTVVAAALIGACSSGLTPGASAPGASTPGSGTPGPIAIDGHTYFSTGSTGVTLVPGSRVTLMFKAGQISASAGCNSMGGGYTLTGDRLTTAGMFMTEMACAEPLMKQDQWLATFIADVKVTQDGNTLTLDDGKGTTLTLLDKEVATPDQPIEGTLWVLDGIVTGDSVSSVPQGVTASIRIVDGNLELNAGCNKGGGPVTVAADALTFGPLVLTKMACEGPGAAVEGAMTAVLKGTVPYSIDADSLTLDAGANGLMFKTANQD